MANVAVNATISARDAASKNIKTVNKALGTLGKTASNIGNDFKKVALGIAGVAAGVGAFTISAIKDAAADQAATAKLNAALKARKLATESVLAAVERQIIAGQKLAFTDDEVRASVEASTRFTKNYAVAQKIQTVAMDLSRQTGMSLADATIAVGKAYSGTGKKLLTTLGITTKNIKGQAALNAILGKTKGSAAAYADTVEGSFQVLAIGAAELKEQFGDAFLPAVTKLFKGLAPYLDKFANTIKANTPQLQKWADTIVNKILENLPKLFREFQRLVPRALKGIEGFVDKIAGIGKEADGLLGPGGSITLLVTGIGAAFGGLKGAITANLLKGGMDPFTALIVGNIASQIPVALANALISTVVTKAVAGFGASVAAASAGGAAASAAAGVSGTAASGGLAALLGAAALPVTIVALTAAAAAAIGAATGNMQNTRVARGDITQEQALVETGSQGAGNIALYSSPSAAKETKQIFDDFLAFINPFDGGKTRADRPAFSTTSDPMTAKYTSNIYIGTGKVDTVVTDSLKRTGNYTRGR